MHFLPPCDFWLFYPLNDAVMIYEVCNFSILHNGYITTQLAIELRCVATRLNVYIKSNVDVHSKRTLKKCSKCVKSGTKSRNFEKNFQSAFRVYIDVTFDVNF